MKRLFQISAAFALVMVLTGAALQAQKWSSDPVHSNFVFQVRHILTPFVGKFDRFQVDIVWNENDLSKSMVNATVDARSVNTGMADREKHLRSPEFFNAAQNPEWSFASTGIQKTKDGYLATGMLTANGKTNKLSVPFKFLGIMELEKGSKAGFSAEFSIKRSDYDLGGTMGGGIGDEGKLMVFLEMVAK